MQIINRAFTLALVLCLVAGASLEGLAEQPAVRTALSPAEGLIIEGQARTALPHVATMLCGPRDVVGGGGHQ
jgi:hypothetical protein